MRIQQSDVLLASRRAASVVDATSVAARAWVDAPQAASRPSPAAVVSLPAAKPASAAPPAATDGAATEADDQDPVDTDPRTRLLRLIVEQLTGQRVRVLHAHDLHPGRRHGHDHARGSAASPSGQASQPSQPARQGWGASVRAESTHEETEATTVTATGTAELADGRRITFDLELDMRRHYEEHATSEVLLGDAARKVDPLALSFDGGPVDLAGTRTPFDLNGDGTAEQVAMPGQGTAFLALDRNANGRIDDGTELFGPATGNGFAELAALDADANGWIDEADPVYASLRVWTGAADDAGTSLASAGVGALYLANVTSLFDLRDTTNQSLGQVRSSSVYLAEDGGVGALQQVDLTA